jgi:hypothetical protein
MGKCLHKLLLYIDKVPFPPPVNNPTLDLHEYRMILTRHISTIESMHDFNRRGSQEYFICFDNVSYTTIKSSSSPRSSLSFILNDEKEDQREVQREYKEFPVHIYQSKDSEDQETWNVQGVISKIDIPSSLLLLSEEEFEKKKEVVCNKIANIFINIYDLSLKEQIVGEINRRRQYRTLISLLACYEKLQTYCNLCKGRSKGQTIKAQAMKLIVKLSKPQVDQPPQIKKNMVLKLITRATRIQRLLEIASFDYKVPIFNFIFNFVFSPL